MAIPWYPRYPENVIFAFRKSTISINSSLASSMPATFSNFTPANRRNVAAKSVQNFVCEIDFTGKARNKNNPVHLCLPKRIGSQHSSVHLTANCSVSCLWLDHNLGLALISSGKSDGVISIHRARLKHVWWFETIGNRYKTTIYKHTKIGWWCVTRQLPKYDTANHPT